MTVLVISFKGVALNWYKGKEDRESFEDWDDLKILLLS